MSLFDAITAGDADEVRRLVAEDPTAPGQRRADDGVSPIRFARYLGRTDLVEVIRGANPELDVFDAAAVGDVDSVITLVDADPALVNATAGDGHAVLSLAAFFGHLEVVDALLERGADPDVVATGASRLRPLHGAAAGGHVEIVERLLAAGADPNARQAGGFTPLMEANHRGDTAMAEVLLATGADPTLTPE